MSSQKKGGQPFPNLYSSKNNHFCMKLDKNAFLSLARALASSYISYIPSVRPSASHYFPLASNIDIDEWHRYCWLLLISTQFIGVEYQKLVAWPQKSLSVTSTCVHPLAPAFSHSHACTPKHTFKHPRAPAYPKVLPHNRSTPCTSTPNLSNSSPHPQKGIWLHEIHSGRGGGTICIGALP